MVLREISRETILSSEAPRSFSVSTFLVSISRTIRLHFASTARRSSSKDWLLLRGVTGWPFVR